MFHLQFCSLIHQLIAYGIMLQRISCCVLVICKIMQELIKIKHINSKINYNFDIIFVLRNTYFKLMLFLELQ
jgi:hypothetical protein